MAVEEKQRITCPKCGKEADFLIPKTINTEERPDAKEKILSRDLFRWICPACGHAIMLDFSFLYHQKEDRLMVYYVRTDEEEQSARDAFLGDFKVNGVDPELNPAVTNLYRRRIVRDLNHLCEKIAITDAKLDDRVIELMKVAYGSMMREQRPDEQITEILFFPKKGGEYAFSFLRSGRGVFEAPFTRKLYETIAGEFQDVLTGADSEPVIDFAWAAEQYRKKDQQAQGETSTK